jgi:branched-chain amino acid transport system permease protein
MVVLGGMGSTFGPLIGAIALLVLEEVLSRLTEYWQIMLGPLLLLVVLFARRGIDGLLETASRMTSRKKPDSGAAHG